MTDRAPKYAAGWKALSMLLEGDEREKAIDKGLELEADIETKGMLLINKAIILNAKGEKEKAKEMQSKLILDPEASYGCVEVAKFTLNSMIQSK